MTATPEILALQQAHATCLAHRRALREALADLRQRDLKATDLPCLSKEDRRLLDQFAYRYTRLQDDMGVRLLPAILKALAEEVGEMPVADRLNRLEQLRWLDSAAEWLDLRRIRNEFAHDYPSDIEERFARIRLAMTAAERLVEILDGLSQKITRRFPDLKST